ncbi:hypothetical protein B7C51_25255 (plasmid) [Paenibacillus larvae subsp. pulvifaciens]|uniref:Mannosyl-glycoprotein endo-beta-N-acetylglucosamidase-like domain-containing protein n=1 Tax=Paenibacillus larvae subsp. pulvifaciens TaxID=1477 RepID=A0A1V0V0A3_9BACL|nr:glucosaminidase domain-containing protein [Paenibacillus larvae]ARF70781.1 hypothetical protein B7C51_25255 [Paenibacillus larvae subsp. pulvifaciens]
MPKGFEKQINEFLGSLKLTDENNIEKNIAAVKLLATDVSKVLSDIPKKSKEPAKDAAESIKSLKERLESLNYTKADGFIDALTKIEKKVQVAEQSVLSFKDVVKSLTETYDESSEKISIMNKLLEDNAEGKAANADEVVKLIEKDSSMVDLFDVQNGQIKLNIRAIDEKKNAEIESFRQVAEERQMDLIRSNQALNKKLRLFDIEITSIESLRKALANLTEQRLLEKSIERGEMGPPDLTALNDTKNAVSDAIKEIDNLRKQSEIMEASLPNKGLSKTKEKIKETTEEVSKLQKALDDVNNTLDKLSNREQMYARSSQAYRDTLKEQIAMLKEKRDLLKQGIDNPSSIMPIKTITESYGGGSAVASSGGSGKGYSGSLVNFNLTQQTNVTASELDAWINKRAPKNSLMRGQGATFLKAAQASGLDPIYLVAHAALESGWGTSNIVRKKGNWYGIGAFDASPYASAYSYNNSAAGIVEGAKWIARNYVNKGQNTLYRMNHNNGKHEYATDPNWNTKIASIMGSSGFNIGNGGSGIYASSNSGSSLVSKVKDYTEKELYDKKNDLMKEYDRIQVEILQREKAIMDSVIAAYDEHQSALDILIKKSEVIALGYVKNSREYRQELEEQNGLLKYKQVLLHNEAEEIRASGLVTDELNSKLQDLGSSWWDLRRQIEEKTFEIITNKLDEMSEAISKVDIELKILGNQMSEYDEKSADYQLALKKQIEMLKEKQQLAHEEAEYIREQLKNDDLSAQRKKELSDRAKELGSSWWEFQTAIMNVEKTLKQQKENIADQLIQLYKDMYAKQKEAALDALDKESEALDKNYDKKVKQLDDELKKIEEIAQAKIRAKDEMVDERRYNQELSKKQRVRQELMNKINALSMDNSAEAKIKLRELNKQLAEMDLDIENMQYERKVENEKKAIEDHLESERKRIEDEKKNSKYKIEIWEDEAKTKKKIVEGTYEELKEKLKEEKESISKHFDNLINDERKFAELKKQIMNGTFDSTKSEFIKFKEFLEKNSEFLGESIQKNLIDKINELNNMMKNTWNEKMIIDKMKENSSKYADANDEEKDRLEKENEELGKLIGAHKDRPTGIWYDKYGNLLYKDYVPGGKTEKGIIEEMRQNGSKWASADDEEKRRLEEANQKLGKQIGAEYDSPTGTWWKDGKRLYDEYYIPKSNEELYVIDQMKANGQKWGGSNDLDKRLIERENQELGGKIGATYHSRSGIWFKNGLRLYHNGGIIGENGDRLTNLFNELANKKPNEKIIKALEGELAIPPKNIMNNLIPNLRNLITKMTPNLSFISQPALETGSNNIYINIDNVVGNKEDAETMATVMINNLKKAGMKF